MRSPSNHGEFGISSTPSNPTGTDRDLSPVTADLLGWYDRSRRVLPWRALPGEPADPYGVWLSEIMLQQTTVQAVKPFYAKFLKAWPKVDALAAATLDDVLRAWAGLGYYSRARNLHACAKTVVAQHDGVFPDSEAGLRALPGIGLYTAAAIAAIAFGRQATVVDGNVERVMARLFAVDEPVPRAKPLLYGWMAKLTPADRPGDFAQATMDLGATICTPRKPNCMICPLRQHCAAAASGAPETYPVRLPKAERPVRHGTVYYIQSLDGAVLVRTRPAKGLLGGMTELPGPAWENGPPPSEGSDECPVTGRVKHVFTHFTLYLDVVLANPDDETARLYAKEADCRWVADRDLDAEALPTLMVNAVKLARAAKI